MRLLVISVLALAAVGWGSYSYLGAGLQRNSIEQKFVERSKREGTNFAPVVEKAVGHCVRGGDLSSEASSKMRSISGAIVSKIVLVRADRPDGDLRPQIFDWLKEAVADDLRQLSDDQFNAVVSTIKQTLGSRETLACIVSTAVTG